ncbi:hypothetical protein VNO77_00641 [Canavalia gladiata]|uniref:BHLH domain-containing protein n=1 Tax=Canavalia gladiata TaxID=3824 RepID=A0AAN9MW98_CANGL
MDHKEKKKMNNAMPAKTLMAECHLRKKLNHTLYMLRSLFPNITKVTLNFLHYIPPPFSSSFIQLSIKMVLGNAIEHLKELVERMNNIDNELESTPAGSSLTPASSFHPLTPILPALPELCLSSLLSPHGQPARIYGHNKKDVILCASMRM